MLSPYRGNCFLRNLPKDRELNHIGKSNRKGLAGGRYASGDDSGFCPPAKPLQNYRVYFVLVPKGDYIEVDRPECPVQQLTDRVEIDIT